MFIINTNKTCRCCNKSIKQIKDERVLGIELDLIWFNCNCGSTLVMPISICQYEGEKL